MICNLHKANDKYLNISNHIQNNNILFINNNNNKNNNNSNLKYKNLKYKKITNIRLSGPYVYEKYKTPIKGILCNMYIIAIYKK